MKLRWRFGIIAGLFLVVFSLYPQLKMFYLRGAEWNGNYAYNDIDEVAYAGYLKALIDGRPRKNDPYTGRDDSPDNPQPESLFSIQFAAPYTIAIPARLFGVGAPWAMTISGAVAAFLTALAIFWLLGVVTGDSLFAMAGSLVVLCGGALFAGEGAIGEVLWDGFSYPYFPGFRRYIPAMAFPAFFVILGLVWKLVGSGPDGAAHGEFAGDRRLDGADDIDQPNAAAGGSDWFDGRKPLLIVLASMAFGYTVFSYFFVWTTAAAWLGCLGACWLIARPEGFRVGLRLLIGLGVGCTLLLIPYAYLLSNRSRSMDDVQLLVNTHAPDLTRTPELISFVVLAVIASGVIFKVFDLKDRGTLFAASLALTPIIVFNQQVIFGRALQPIHYQVFIGNYVAGLAVVMTLGIIWRQVAGREAWPARFALVLLALAAVTWGFVECHFTVRVLDDVNVARDEAYPVAQRLAELGRADPGSHHRVVLDLSLAESDDLPTIAPQAVLWARHQHVFAGVTVRENKERYYQYLYYSGVGGEQLADGMKHRGDFVSMIALFGWGRHTDRLNSDFKPLTFGEIDDEAAKYTDYVDKFDACGPDVVRLDYLIAPAEPYLENIDKWYQRDEGETFGKYTLYKLTLR